MSKSSKTTDSPRAEYVITKEGEEPILGWLFPDNVLYWERRGYTVTRQPWPRP